MSISSRFNVSTKVKDEITKELKRQIDVTVLKAKEEWGKVVAAPLHKEIMDSINAGISPVSGVGRYQGYSTSYKKAINDGRYRRYRKMIRPVNLKLTGALHKSYQFTPLKNGFMIEFKDPKAKYHNDQGAGRSKVRRPMIPNTKKGEEWSRTIFAILRDTWRDVLINNIKK